MNITAIISKDPTLRSEAHSHSSSGVANQRQGLYSIGTHRGISPLTYILPIQYISP